MEDQPQNDPSNWKWGVFYYNKNDDRLFPPKRIPWMGWTINFGHRWSVPVMLIMLMVPIASVIAGIVKHR